MTATGRFRPLPPYRRLMAGMGWRAGIRAADSQSPRGGLGPGSSKTSTLCCFIWDEASCSPQADAASRLRQTKDRTGGNIAELWDQFRMSAIGPISELRPSAIRLASNPVVVAIHAFPISGLASIDWCGARRSCIIAAAPIVAILRRALPCNAGIDRKAFCRRRCCCLLLRCGDCPATSHNNP